MTRKFIHLLTVVWVEPYDLRMLWSLHWSLIHSSLDTKMANLMYLQNETSGAEVSLIHNLIGLTLN